jgi:hypothetical protein
VGPHASMVSVHASDEPQFTPYRMKTGKRRRKYPSDKMSYKGIQLFNEILKTEI